MPGVHRYLLTAPADLNMDTWAVTAMFTNWIEGRSNDDRETWLVTCFDDRSHSFLAAAENIGVTIEEIEGAGDSETYRMVIGAPGSGWQQPVIRHPRSGRVHRIRPDWRDHYRSEHTQCGLPTTNMTERLHVQTVDEADRCKRCWP